MRLQCAWCGSHGAVSDVDSLGGVKCRSKQMRKLGTTSPDAISGIEASKDMCLVRCFHNYGLPVTPTSDGPFWIIRDGNSMLQPWGHAVLPVPKESLRSDGRYIIHEDCHFFNLWVQAGGSACLRMDGRDRRFLVTEEIDNYIRDPTTSVFRFDGGRLMPYIYGAWCPPWLKLSDKRGGQHL